MSRTLAGFAILLTAIAVPPVSLHAQEPGKPELTKSGSGTLLLSGVKTNSGSAAISGGTSTLTISGPATLLLSAVNTSSGSAAISGGTPALNIASGTVLSSGVTTISGVTTTNGGVLEVNNAVGGVDACYATTLSFCQGGFGFTGGGIGFINGAMPPRTPPMPIPNGPVFYIVTEGAGTGDIVRTVPCTGKETVLSAVGAVSGISQVSGTKIWIARPSPDSRDKGTILTINWEAISKRGINATNYTLMPGDRLVFGEDPLTTRSNLMAKKVAPVERIDGIVGLTTSTVRGLQSTPAACALIEELLRKGFMTDDEELKRIVLDAIRLAEKGMNAGPKAAEEKKPGQAEEKPSAAGPKTAAQWQDRRGEEEPITAASKAWGAEKPQPAEKKSTIAAEAAPHELALRPLPDYRIEPPDVIQIEMLKLVPKQRQPVTGQYLVAPDGTVNLRQYGRVCLMGKTVAAARLAIQKQLATYLESPELAVDVVAYNSKVYYIITQGAGLGDNVRRLPVTGKETVLDAISQVNGLSQVSSKKICVVRPSAADGGKAAILPVDWEAVTSRGATATNYQIFPGDRIFIAQNPLVTRSNLIAAKTAPIERIMGIVSLTTSTVSGLNSTPGAGEVLKELLRKGLITDDVELKKIVLDAIRRDEEGKKAAAKASAAEKPEH